jgi:hypothetical protein
MCKKRSINVFKPKSMFKKKEEYINVYILTSTINKQQQVFSSIENLLHFLKSDMEEMDFSDEFTITKSKISNEIYSKLPDFNGY